MFSKTKAKVNAILDGQKEVLLQQGLLVDKLSQVASRIGQLVTILERQKEIVGGQAILIGKLSGLADRFDQMVRIHEEVVATARGRESALETLLIERAKEARAATSKIEVELKEKEESKPSKYDGIF